MLIDSLHRPWISATAAIGLLATALYAWLDQRRPGGVTGGSVPGLWYGILGSLMMIYAGLLSALRKVPSWWWLGSRKTWLRGHLWFGLLSELFILLHSGFRWGGPLEQVLWVLLTLTILTGVVGLLLQQVLPRMLSTRLPGEVPYEQIAHIGSLLRRRADTAVDACCGNPGVAHATSGKDEPAWSQDGSAKGRLRKLYEEEVRPFLSGPYRRDALPADPRALEAEAATIAAQSWSTDVQECLATLGTLCEERRQLGEQERLHHLLHGWLLVHVPLSVSLLVLGLVHAVVSLYY